MNRKYRKWAAEKFFKRFFLVILLPLFIAMMPVAWGIHQAGRFFNWLRG